MAYTDRVIAGPARKLSGQPAVVMACASEYSIMERALKRDVIPACDELSIGFVVPSDLVLHWSG
jgi:aryl-alcohol dehydrogenase-like predicted oxidoreductase